MERGFAGLLYGETCIQASCHTATLNHRASHRSSAQCNGSKLITDKYAQQPDAVFDLGIRNISHRLTAETTMQSGG